MSQKRLCYNTRLCYTYNSEQVATIKSAGIKITTGLPISFIDLRILPKIILFLLIYTILYIEQTNIVRE